jgi:hypothetical protein
VIRDPLFNSSKSCITQVTPHMHLRATTAHRHGIPSIVSLVFHAKIHHCLHLDNEDASATSIHFTLIHSTTDAKAIITTMPAITLPLISNASLTSNLATCRIFLFRCHDFFSLFLLLSACSPSFGPIASFGSTCVVAPLRPQLESLGS